MNLIETLNQNAFIAIIVIFVPIVGITWKVLHELFVKPRDFRINSLTENQKKLEDEVVELRRMQERNFAPAPQKNETRSVAIELIDVSSVSEDPVRSDDLPLASLARCYAQWRSNLLTKLQRQKFEEECTGKIVEWIVRVSSVSETERGIIHLYFTDDSAGWDKPRGSATFRESDRSRLLKIDPESRVKIRGRIKEFFLWPVLDDCQVQIIDK